MRIARTGTKVPRVQTAAFLLSLALFADVSAPAVRPYDRIVALVGDHVILLSELQGRAKPFTDKLKEIPDKDRPALEKRLMRELCERMVDEAIEGDAAEKLHLTVDDAEVAEGLKNIAAQNGVDVKTVLGEAARLGLSEPEYRGELRRQLIEGKLLRMLGGSVVASISPADVKARYEELKKQVKDPKDLKDFASIEQALTQQIALERLEAFRRDMVERMRSSTYVEIRVDRPPPDPAPAPTPAPGAKS
ncbi:MAG TPA: SurA N-terminal domain-containing protein [Polyangiaceae bacterium]